MATEQQPAALGPPKELRVQQSSLAVGMSGSEQSQPIEFRGFDFFSQREHNEYKDASRAYFAEKNGNPASWLGDPSPPASAHTSLDEPRPVPGPLSPPNGNELRDDKRILGLQRPWLWTVLGIVGVIIIVAIGVGVGVGVGTKVAGGSKSADGVAPASDATGTTITGTSAPIVSVITMVTSSSSSLTATRTPTATPTATPKAGMGCPDINGTIYQVPGSTKKFLQLCGVDHGKEDGAIDLHTVYTDTVQDCIDNCAGTTGCTGCGWGFIDGDKGPPFRCWLKDRVNGKSHRADKTWSFAVLL